MTIWNPTLETTSQPRYLALASAIERDIKAGRLKAGDQLPTHRDLAGKLDVTIGTITRGYREAQKRGLITGEVGRGSFVKEQSTRAFRFTWDKHETEAGVIGLGQNFPVPLPEIEQRIIGPIMRDIASDEVSTVMSAAWPALLPRHQEIGVRWLERYRIEAPPQRVLISTGFQSALWAIVGALCEAGDVILTDQLTTPGLLTLAGTLKVRVVGVPGDEHGMEPAALKKAIDEHGPRMLYLTPTIQTPTTAVMPEARRREIAAVTAPSNLLIIEDDDNWPLLSDQAMAECGSTIASLAEDRTFLVADLSRALGLGIRLSYVLAPARRLDEIAAALTSTTWMPAPLIAEIAARLIDDAGGAGADSIIAARREELAARHELSHRILPSTRLSQHPAGHHVWLRLPEEWRSESFAAEAQRRGVLVNSSSTFAMNRAMSPGAVRICIGAPRRREDLEYALRTLAQILAAKPGAGGMVV